MSHQKSILLPAVMAVGLLTSGHCLAAQKYYKWVDEQGVTHYAAQPSADHPSTTIRTTNLEGTPAPTTAAADEKPQPAGSEPPQPKSAERCSQSQKDLQTIESNSRIRVTMDDGSFRYLSPAEIETRRQQAQSDIADNCE